MRVAGGRPWASPAPHLEVLNIMTIKGVYEYERNQI
jgi:hypothetical protein